ncbi:MAG: rod-binding protein [Paracoccaceae bacterium]
MQLLPTSPGALPNQSAQNQLLEKANEMEAAFLSEMLAHAGLGESPDGFGGGLGEEQFSSFLRSEQARSIVDKGGLGLAQTIFDSLVKAREGQNGR